jgi:hypothetical protein
MNRSRVILSLIVSAAALCAPMTVLAMCYERDKLSVLGEFESSNVVIVGLVRSATPVSSPDDPDGVDKYLYKVKILKSFKGATKGTVTVTTENTSSRFPLDKGRKYLLFLKSVNTDMSADSCGNSGRIESRKHELSVLNSAREHAKPTTIDKN